MQRILRVITLQGAIEKSPILLLQYWKYFHLIFFDNNSMYSIHEYTVDENIIATIKM